MKKTIFNYAFNIAMLWLVYIGLWGKTEWAQNIFVFVIWFSFILYMFVAFSEELQNKMKEKDRSMHIIPTTIFNVSIICSLVVFGWFLTASIHIISTIIDYGIFKDNKKEDKT